MYINENKKIPSERLESRVRYTLRLVFARQHLDVDSAIHYDEVQSPTANMALTSYGTADLVLKGIKEWQKSYNGNMEIVIEDEVNTPN